MFGDTSRRNPHYADLEAYYLNYNPSAFQRLCREYSVDSFSQLQQKIIRNCAGEVNVRLKHAKKLVVLIHGFNEYAELPYDTLENAIHGQLAGEDLEWLEVYWDGLKADAETPGHVLKIWARANRSAPYAAMTLRKLFAQVDDADLYIIAHSLGACVATRLLFNTNEGRHFPHTEEWEGLPTPRQSSITLALLAPAIAGKRVFACINRKVPLSNEQNYKRLVVGYNKYDYATTKSMRFPLSRLYYSTSLGCNPSEVMRTGRVLRRLLPALRYHSVDFSSEEIRHGTHRIHHIRNYIARHDDFTHFLEATFWP
jgi:pimeloyl-ACP methyl ester carboxylesterase